MSMNKGKVVIIGGGFGGLTAAKELKNSDYEIVLIDKTNHHLFQPLLYQVATAALSPGDIAAPIRGVLNKQKNVKVIMGEVLSIDRENKKVILEDDEINFDYLILSTGASHSYFGNEHWEEHAPGLKTIPDALRIREKMLLSFEKAEKFIGRRNIDPFLTFVVVGGGPTGVEVAGAIAEISKKTMLQDFRKIDPSKTKVILIEALDRILVSYDPSLSEAAKNSLEELGVDVRLNSKVVDVNKEGVKVDEELIETKNIIWAAGNNASDLLKSLNTELDRAGRVIVNKDCSIKGDKNIFVIGDAANFKDEYGNSLPALAPVAMQQGKYVAKILVNDSAERKPFKYFDKGSMATIGRARAIMQSGKLKLTGFLAWLAWSFVHILFLIGFRNRYKVMAEWIWYYLSYRHGIRLITNKADL